MFGPLLENPLLSHSQQEMMYVESGVTAYIRIGESTFHCLNTVDDPCQTHPDISYTEVGVLVNYISGENFPSSIFSLSVF